MSSDFGTEEYGGEGSQTSDTDDMVDPRSERGDPMRRLVLELVDGREEA